MNTRGEREKAKRREREREVELISRDIIDCKEIK